MIILSRILLLFLVHPVAFAQDISKKEKRFNRLLDGMLSHSVEEVGVHEVAENDGAVWLDARERGEYEVSKIDGAVWVGYDDFDLERVSGVSKEEEVIVYCSIGYRSEKIAEKLKEQGYNNVKNLYGGIFSWINHDKKVYDATGLETKKVHAYNRLWGIWLEKGEKVY